MKTNKKGISLIVLIITIVVMIIIAAAVILYLDESKVVKNAKKAVNASNISAAKEVITVARAEWRVNRNKIEESTFKEYAERKLEEAGFEIGTNGGQVTASENGLLYAYVEPVIPVGFVASNVSTEDEVSEGLVIYEGVVPVTSNNVSDAKTTRNQYVWVPVPNMSEFVRKEYNNGTKISETTSYNLDDTTEAAEYSAMKESVAKYGGFYIARNRGKQYKNWSDAKNACKLLSTDQVVGHLIYGEEWDAALDFGLKNITPISTYGVQWTCEYVPLASEASRIARYGSSSERVTYPEIYPSKYSFPITRSALYLK